MNLHFLLSTSSGSNIKRAFLTSSFAMLIPYLREINSVIYLYPTFAKDVPNSLEIIAIRSSSETFLFLVRFNLILLLTVAMSTLYDDAH